MLETFVYHKITHVLLCSVEDVILYKNVKKCTKQIKELNYFNTNNAVIVLHYIEWET